MKFPAIIYRFRLGEVMSRNRGLSDQLRYYLALLLIGAFCCEQVPAQSVNRISAGLQSQIGYSDQTRNRNRRPPRQNTDIQPSGNFLGEFQASFAAGYYERAFLLLANYAGFYYDQNNFAAAMQVYRVFANFADPFTTIDPSDAKEEAIRKSTVLKDMTRNYAKFMINTYQVRPEICRANNCLDLGWEMTEKIKSRLLRIELINNSLSRLDQTERQRIEGLLARVRHERMERNRLRIATGNLLGPTEKDAAIAALDSEIAKYLPEYAALASEIVPLHRVREALGENETLLSFVYTNNHRHVYVWKIQKNDPPNQPPVIKTKITTETLFIIIEWLKKAIAAGASLEDVSGALNVIYRDLIEPLNLTAGRRLIIAADQNLSALPFDIIPWAGGQRMIDAFDITYVPSSNVFYHLRQRRRTQGGRESYQFDYAGFGYAGGEGDELIHTETEIENAARSLPRNVMKSNAAEADIYRQAAKIADSRFLHFATHNYLVPGVDASFYLTFGKGENENGRLTSQEVMARLRNRAELTVLSSCETAPANDNYAMGQITPMDPRGDGSYVTGTVSFCICSYGESFSNLTGAFFAAGSKRLLLTQWRIRDDAVTDVFISKLFKLLAEGRPPEAALKEVKLKMRNQKPVFWAGFILAGD
jgi:CHAT domain-containing protein